jgi:proline dehydrogenase
MLRSLFIGLSTSRRFRSFSERSALGQRVSRRFVAGMTVEDAIAVAARLNAEGIEISLDSLGESVTEGRSGRGQRRGLPSAARRD